MSHPVVPGQLFVDNPVNEQQNLAGRDWRGGLPHGRDKRGVHLDVGEQPLEKPREQIATTGRRTAPARVFPFRLVFFPHASSLGSAL